MHLRLVSDVHVIFREYNLPSKSLKLLPILGLPSLPSLPLLFIPGLLPDNSAVRFGLSTPGLPLCLLGVSVLLVTGAVDDALESEVCEISPFLWLGFRRVMPLGSPRRVAEGSWCASPDVNGRNAGSSSSSSSASSLKPSLLGGNLGGRRKTRDCAGEEDDDSEVSGEDRLSSCGDRCGESADGSLGLAAWWRYALAGRGEVGVREMVVMTFPEGVRDKGRAILPDTPSLFGIGESLRLESEDCMRPVPVSFVRGTDIAGSPPPEPVLLMDSPPVVSDVLPGTGDGAADLVAPTFRICARTCDS
jgi:hypothetical protein